MALLTSSLMMLPFFSQGEVVFSNPGDSVELVEKGNESVVYSFDNLTDHDAIFVNFDLYVLDSWDSLCPEGTVTGVCNDFFGVEINGEVHKWAFNRTQGAIYYNDQSLPVYSDFNTGSFGGSERWGPIDSFYENFNNGLYIPHTADSFEIRFFGEGLQPIDDESWAITNLSITSFKEGEYSKNGAFDVSDVPGGIGLGVLAMLPFFCGVRKKHIKKQEVEGVLFELKKSLLVIPFLALLSANATAGVVTNDSDLLTSSGHEKLSEWLGKDVDLTRVFEKVSGSTGSDWSQAVDKKGPTITLFEILSESGSIVVGGYNDKSWRASYSSSYDADSTNFLFNLNDESLYPFFNERGVTTAATPSGGPKFGSSDLSISSDLNSGVSYIGRVYGDPEADPYNLSYLSEFIGSTSRNFSVGKMETFTISDSVIKSDVPINAGFALLPFSLLFFRKRKSI